MTANDAPAGDWTYGYRKPTANRIFRVSDWCGTWDEARDRATRVGADSSAHFFVLTTRTYDDLHPSEDSHNLLMSNGKRISLVETSETGLLQRVGAAR